MKIFKILLLISIFSLSGCLTTKVNLDVTSSDNLNLNKFDEPLPVVLKIYQLTDIQAFNNATYEQLWKADKSVLANSLVTVEEKTINPSQITNISFEQSEQAKYIAMVALFRDIEGGKWRTSFELSNGYVKIPTSLDIALNKNSIVILGAEED
ncbi:type VI secretion system lipoprotein TssJ [Pseudoalteromonas phenolica]|uniref:type VI secretion system lipoprotein TssJ n=1 Tax=Pseudoalteromonas phenolica TaxID=161398 RepID=UPI00110A59C6|nr:type VI secretion system lipoprotein TssJ [Pseudoalteromonas phenolica]TMO56962.1 type VI secretion system lipoprotein TssJ [Pseudoalteromonas phenolica]